MKYVRHFTQIYYGHGQGIIVTNKIDGNIF